LTVLFVDSTAGKDEGRQAVEEDKEKVTTQLNKTFSFMQHLCFERIGGTEPSSQRESVGVKSLETVRNHHDFQACEISAPGPLFHCNWTEVTYYISRTIMLANRSKKPAHLKASPFAVMPPGGFVSVLKNISLETLRMRKRVRTFANIRACPTPKLSAIQTRISFVCCFVA
jgi:hypothetical protein